MKLWLDDLRPAPDGYILRCSVNEAKKLIEYYEEIYNSELKKEEHDELVLDTYKIDLIDIDHDAGDYISDGGDYIKLLDWLEETGRNYPIRIHSMNPVGRENMRRIIRKNGWKEIE